MGIIPGEIPRAGGQRDDPGYGEQGALGLKVDEVEVDRQPRGIPSPLGLLD